MALTVDDILTKRVRLLLRDIDEGGVQWRDAELINWFNEACEEISRLQPESSSKTVEVSPLQQGAKQTVPQGTSLLLEAVCNSSDGNEGRIVRRVERSTLDNEEPDWMMSERTDVVMRYAASLTDPRVFYVYPPSSGSANSGLSIVVATVPDKVTQLTDMCPLPDMYSSVIANYVLHRAFSKLTESADAQQRAIHYLQLFDAQVGTTINTMEGRTAPARDPIGPGV
ncbi:DUF6682 family protein [Shewanella gaetbuli]|uniref:Uncharacterized protein n=1 Tax=Shewanella gaetbuli TaxID=220752 RepID=A0A9X1ZII2_9GAMM|nr:DUF6682 family protein [Shewanella gaetbuli]MCL1142979.1 hypothetical protein [Shewanella gaetbuli]